MPVEIQLQHLEDRQAAGDKQVVDHTQVAGDRLAVEGKLAEDMLAAGDMQVAVGKQAVEEADIQQVAEAVLVHHPE